MQNPESKVLKPRIGRYDVVRLLGQGAVGSVYLARDAALEREVALKTIRLSAAKAADFEGLRARFMREAKLTARLSHPNIVVVYEFGEDDGQLFLAMEFVSGGTLAERLVTDAVPFSMSQRVLIGAEISEALVHAHERGVLHRDLKPANILLTESLDAKVTDFGIGKLIGATVDLTGTGEMVGSPAYMSPEQMRGEKLDTRSDVFGFGVVFYQLLTGRKPFPSENLTLLVSQVQNEDPQDPRELEPDVPEKVAKIVLRCLAKERESRYATAAELAQDLRTVLPAVPDIAGTLTAMTLKRSKTASDPAHTLAVATPALAAPTAGPTEPTMVSPAKEKERAPTMKTRESESRRTLAILGGLLTAAILVGVFFWKRPASRPHEAEPSSLAAAPTAPPTPAVPKAVAPTATPAPPEPTPTRVPRKPTKAPTAAATVAPAPVIPPGKSLHVATRRGLTLKVTPDQARVFLDGRYIGVADDWDDRGGGAILVFLFPGAHKLRLALSGYGDLVIDLSVSKDAPQDFVTLTEAMVPGTPAGSTGPSGKIGSPDYRTIGPVVFNVQPPDAEITIGGKSYGTAVSLMGQDVKLSDIGVYDVVIAKGEKKKTVRLLVGPTAGVPRAVIKEKL